MFIFHYKMESFVHDIMKIHKGMGLELLKVIVYSAATRKYTPEYSIDFLYYNYTNVPNGIPVPSRHPTLKECISVSPLPKEYMHLCIWFVHDWLCDKDFWKPFKTHVMKSDEDEDKIRKLIKFTSYDDKHMQAIYAYILAHWNELNLLFNHLRNKVFKQAIKINDILFADVEYNSGKDRKTKYYKMYDAVIDMIINKNLCVNIRYAKTVTPTVKNKWKTEMSRIQAKRPWAFKGRKKAVFNLGTLELVYL